MTPSLFILARRRCFEQHGGMTHRSSGTFSCWQLQYFLWVSSQTKGAKTYPENMVENRKNETNGVFVDVLAQMSSCRLQLMAHLNLSLDLSVKVCNLNMASHLVEKCSFPNAMERKRSGSKRFPDSLLLLQDTFNAENQMDHFAECSNRPCKRSHSTARWPTFVFVPHYNYLLIIIYHSRLIRSGHLWAGEICMTNGMPRLLISLSAVTAWLDWKTQKIER